jgi:hypothetical protein
LDSRNNDTKEIHCFDRDSIPIFCGTIIINRTDTLALDENGKATYNAEIENIQILGLMTRYNLFSVKSRNYSKIAFFVDNFVCHSPDYLTNEKLIIDGKEIKEFYHCLGKYAEKGLKKTNIKNKRF